MKKGIFHLHTDYSFDCWVAPYKIVERARKLGIDHVVIADHDSLAGSIEARKYVKDCGYSLSIPVAGEFFTDIGDIIVVGVTEAFEKTNSHRELCQAAKKKGGYTILPHPYDYHKLDLIDFDSIDLIEVFNSRSTMDKNLASLQLALDLKKPMIYGADAHFLKDIDKAIFFYSGESPFTGTNYSVKLQATSLLSKDCSQLIKSWKIKNPKLAIRIFKRVFLRWTKAFFSLVGW